MPTIRTATNNDFDILREMYLSEVEPHNERAKAFANDLLSLMNTILCFDDERLCGTVSWAIRGGMDDGVIEIIGLGVNEHHRRKGIATKLIHEALEEAKRRFESSKYTLRRVFLFMEDNIWVGLTGFIR